MNAAIQVFDDAILSVLSTDFDIETLCSDCKFTEGPVWNNEGFYLFSDITANAVYKLVPGREREIFIPNSGTENLLALDLKAEQAGSNGLAYNKEGTLLVCRHGSHMIAEWKEERLEPFVTLYSGKPFNSPNDIVADKKGRVFFSDPPYGLKEGKLNPEKFQQLGGVYCFDQGELRLVCDKYQYPNGVCITPGGEQLYICSNKPFEKFISVYDLETLNFQKVLAEENSDGIKCDPQGNVYLSNKDGILVLNPQGQRMALISFATVPANHCFGGGEKKDLFVTARENVFRIKNLLR